MSDTPTPPLPPPADPWAGRDGHTHTLGMASIPQRIASAAPAEPQVVYVERPRRRRWPWVLGTLTVLSLGCCGVLAAVTAPMRTQYPVRAELGATIAGLRRDDSPAVRDAANELIAQIHREQDVTGAEVAKLDEPKRKDRPVVLVVATRFILDPAGELDRALAAAGKDRPAGVRSFPAGARGGELRCGNARDKQSDAPVVVCAWIDHGSLGLGLFYGGRAMDDSARLLREIRDDVLVEA